LEEISSFTKPSVDTIPFKAMFELTKASSVASRFHCLVVLEAGAVPGQLLQQVVGGHISFSLSSMGALRPHLAAASRRSTLVALAYTHCTDVKPFVWEAHL